MRSRVGVGAAVVVLVAAVVAWLSTGASTLAYDNGKLVNVGVVVPPGGEICQGGQYVPKGVTRLRIWVSTAGRRGGPLRLTVLEGSAVVARGGAAGGYRDQPVDLKLTKTPREIADAGVCVRNGGRSRIAVMGDFVGPLGKAPKRLSTVTRDLLNVKQQPAVVSPRVAQPAANVVARLEWHTPPAGPWWSLAGAIARRMAIAKASFFGPWMLWFAAALMIAVTAAATWVVTRREPD